MRKIAPELWLHSYILSHHGLFSHALTALVIYNFYEKLGQEASRSSFSSFFSFIFMGYTSIWWLLCLPCLRTNSRDCSRAFFKLLNDLSELSSLSPFLSFYLTFNAIGAGLDTSQVMTNMYMYLNKSRGRASEVAVSAAAEGVSLGVSGGSLN